MTCMKCKIDLNRAFPSFSERLEGVIIRNFHFSSAACSSDHRALRIFLGHNSKHRFRGKGKFVL